MSDRQGLGPRASGVLLHPTSLRGRFGIGTLGEPARVFVDWLVDAGQSVWQVLPLGPTTFGDSPYQTLSAFAGNPLLIDLDELVTAGWLPAAELEAALDIPAGRVDFGRVIAFASAKLDRAYGGFAAGVERRPAGAAASSAAGDAARDEFAAWCAEQAAWLEDFALFMALKEKHDGRPWIEWPAAERRRDPEALARARDELAARLDRQRFQQWLFHRQWAALHAYAAERGVRLIGDLPIFVAHDSADVWAHPELYKLDAKGRPTVIAGVPPDYFSKTGQRWGNPLYRWDRMRERGYDWWLARLRAALALCDAVRIDHFRGFAANWEIPAGEATAVNGRWVRGPGAEFFAAVRETLGALPIIAEDLGVITPDVEKLRDDFGLPGMKVLQFAWSDPRNTFLPHAHERNCVVYTGTHDNNTTVGWWREETKDAARHFLGAYLGAAALDMEREPHWTLIRVGMMSVAHTFIAPMQDVLGLGPEARMNRPAAADGNWTWRLPPGALDDPAPRERLAELARLYRRRPEQQLEQQIEEQPAPGEASSPAIDP